MPPRNAALAAVAMAAVLVLAGCAGPISGGTDTAAPGDATGATPENAAVDGDSGAVEFYISDEENTIDDFAHLNVTITKVGLHRVDDGSDAATATVNGEAVGETDGSGTVTFTVPEDAEELEVPVTKGDTEVELTREVGGGQGNGALRAVR
jgi:hypothetical protein